MSALQRLSGAQIAQYIGVFFVVLAFVKANQYLFFTFNTSPAVVLLPAGISLAAAYLWGYSMAIPVGLAWLVGAVTSPANPLFIVSATAALGYSLQTLIGAYCLNKLKFEGTMASTRDALILVSVAALLPIIAPSITTGMQWLSGSLTASVWLAWSRSWAGGVMSVLTFTPLITSWVKNEQIRTARPHEVLETGLGLALLIAASYATFWTVLGRLFGFVVLYVLFGVLFWIGLRMRPRMTALALFIIALLGIAGGIIAHPVTTTPLSQQLLNVELFIVLIAPIFYILTSLVEERRISAEKALAYAAQLEENNRQLSEEDQRKNEFIAMLAHELRNPLAPVVSSLELMRLKVQDRPDLIELLDVADTHNRSLTHLLDDLLDISRISRNKIRLQKEVVELQKVIETARKTVEKLYQSRSHTLSVSVPNSPMWVEVDPVRLEQTVVNILNNAGKYTNPGGHIELSVVHDYRRGVRISIKDNGKGLEPSMLGKIFDPFMQVHDGSSAGLGIGLSLSKRLVELHEGEIWAESEGLNKGSTFVIVLPPHMVRTKQ